MSNKLVQISLLLLLITTLAIGSEMDQSKKKESGESSSSSSTSNAKSQVLKAPSKDQNRGAAGCITALQNLDLESENKSNKPTSSYESLWDGP